MICIVSGLCNIRTFLYWHIDSNVVLVLIPKQYPFDYHIWGTINMLIFIISSLKLENLADLDQEISPQRIRTKSYNMIKYSMATFDILTLFDTWCYVHILASTQKLQGLIPSHFISINFWRPWMQETII